MANVLFNSFKEQLLQNTCDLDDSIKWVAVDHGADTPAPTTDDFLDDITVGARIATSAALASKTFTAGVLDAVDTVFTAPTGVSFESLVMFNDTPGTDATKDLIFFVDTATGLPTTPNGADITLVYDNGGNRIFAI